MVARRGRLMTLTAIEWRTTGQYSSGMSTRTGTTIKSNSIARQKSAGTSKWCPLKTFGVSRLLIGAKSRRRAIPASFSNNLAQRWLGRITGVGDSVVVVDGSEDSARRPPLPGSPERGWGRESTRYFCDHGVAVRPDLMTNIRGQVGLVTFHHPKPPFLEVLPDDLSSPVRLISGLVGKEIVASDADNFGLFQRLRHALNGKSFGAFNIHFQKADSAESKLANELIHRCGRNRSAIGISEPIRQVVRRILNRSGRPPWFHNRPVY